MKNKKGFTLVELLAVIVILSIIIGIAIPASVSLSNKSKKKMYFSKVEMILEAAKMYGQDNPTSYSITKSCTKKVTVQQLINDGKLKKDEGNNVVNPFNKEVMNGYQLCLYKENNRITAAIDCSSTTTWKKGLTSDDLNKLNEYCYS